MLRYDLNHPMITREPSLIDWLFRYEPVLDVLLTLEIRDNILDFGSGNVGLGCVWNGPYYGVDVNPIMPQVPNLMPIEVSHPFELEGQFDFVCSMDVLEHIPPSERIRFFQTLRRVSKKWVMISFPTKETGRLMDIEAIPMMANSCPPWLFEHLAQPHPSLGEVFELIGQSGLRVIKRLRTTNRLMYLLGLIGLQVQGTMKVKLLNDIHYLNLMTQDEKVATYRETILLEVAK